MQAIVLFMLFLMLAILIDLGFAWLICFVALGLFHVTLPFWPVFAAILVVGAILRMIRGK